MSTNYPVASEDYKSASIAGYLVVLICFGGLFLWSGLSEIDSAVTAPASILVESRRQVVQHLEGGIVKEIVIREGDFVNQGQVLFRLDDTQTKANLELTRNQYYLLLAQESRYTSERDNIDSITFADVLLENQNQPSISQIMKDQESLFKQRRLSIESQLSILKSRQVTLREEIEGLRTERNSANTQIYFIANELEGIRDLAEKGIVAKTRLNALEREKARLDGIVGRSEVEESKAFNNINEADLQINQIMQKYREDIASGLQDVRAKISDLKEKLRVTEDALRRVDVVAPRAGYVQSVRANTIGQIIRPGESFLEIIPRDDQFLLEAQVQVTDVNSVIVGDNVEIRFPSFHSRLTPVMFGIVKSLSHDQLINEANKQPYFLAQISIQDADIPEDLKSKLRAGMPGEVVFSTGTRTVLQYIMHPLTEAFRHAWREK